MDKKKEEIYQHIYSHTLSQIESKKFNQLGMDALNASIDLQMDRSNASRILNQLHQEGRLVKTQGRPTLYIARSPIENHDTPSYIPNIIPKGKDISDYFQIHTKHDEKDKNTNFFRSYLANRNTSSMYEPIQKAKSSLFYPPHGLNILLYGEPCVGKLEFAKTLYNFGKEQDLFSRASKYVVFDCLNFIDYTTEEILCKLYGYYDGEHLKRGAFESAKNGILVLNHMDCLSFSVLTNIYDSIINQIYTPIHLTGKEFPIRCLIIGVSDSGNLIKNPDIRRSFPMHIYIPSLKEKSIQEMLAITMQYFEEEAQRINRTIRLSKGTLSCFIMSEYSGNLPHLQAEIRQSCAHAFCSFLEQDALFVNIDFDDISTPVLTDIYNVNERMNELDNILNLFDNEYLFFSPLKQNQELELLYELNDSPDKNTTYLNHIDDKLINLCIQDINAAVNIHLNTIRSVMIKQIYDLLYPILQSNPICKNENLMYGLLLHISNTINKIKSGISESGFKSGNYKIAKKEDYECACKIIKEIKKAYDIALSCDEDDYIATYLYLSSQWIDNRYIQMLIISEGNNSAEDFADYLNSLNFKSDISWLRISSKNTPEENCRLINDKMQMIDKDKGVVLATDSKLVESYETILTNISGIEFVIIPNISLKTLISIVEKIESLGSTISTIKYFNKEDKTYQNHMDITESHAQELLNEISDKVLSESLVFLNPTKVCQSLFNVLINIIHDLNISYTDDLLIKFIFHSGFVIERCIRKEPINYPKARSIINQNDSIYYNIEKNFEIICEIFNVTIPSAEMAMIMEIFLPYLN